jgi:hypothetical protein
MRRVIVTLVISLSATLGMSGVALADGGNGDYCGASGNGCANSWETRTPCAGAGGFGAFGKDNNFAGGADGQQTGLNNSSLCGNR